MILIGQHEPEWRAPAYVEGEEQVVRSSDYTRQWHVLYWYPLDFTFAGRSPAEVLRTVQALQSGGLSCAGAQGMAGLHDRV
jgi:alkyl hydroperoxide reductase subunit AhpC